MQVDQLIKAAQQRQYVFHAAGIRRHVRAFGARRQLRGRRDVEGERNILRQVRSGVGKPMLSDESANLFVRIARIRRSLKRLVDLIPNLLAHRVGGGEPLVIAAGIQRRGNVEKRLAVLQADVGAGRIHQSRGIWAQRVAGSADWKKSSERAALGAPSRISKRKSTRLEPGKEIADGLP